MPFLLIIMGVQPEQLFSPEVLLPQKIFSIQVFNHEMGHAMNLGHTFNFDGLDDTPRIRFRFDYNCNGNTTDFWPSPGIGSELTWETCWSVGNDGPIDYDGDGTIDHLKPCNMGLPCTQSWPCCDALYVDNNIMSYSGNKVAYTEGQITRMLGQLSTTYCGYIEEITSSCPPPMANIHIMEGEEEDGCTFCFQIQASMHDDDYYIDFFDGSSLVYSTGYRNGPAVPYCITRAIGLSDDYKNGFEAGILYTAELTVKNACGDIAKESVTFILPGLPPQGCGVDIEIESSLTSQSNSFIELKSVYPNPFSHTINIDFAAKVAGEAEVWLFLASSLDQQYLMESKGLIGIGDHSGSYDTSALPSGLYYAVVILDGEYVYDRLLKL